MAAQPEGEESAVLIAIARRVNSACYIVATVQLTFVDVDWQAMIWAFPAPRVYAAVQRLIGSLRRSMGEAEDYRFAYPDQ